MTLVSDHLERGVSLANVINRGQPMTAIVTLAAILIVLRANHRHPRRLVWMHPPSQLLHQVNQRGSQVPLKLTIEGIGLLPWMVCLLPWGTATNAHTRKRWR